MNWKSIVTVLVITVFVLACSKDEGPTSQSDPIGQPDPENSAPGAFNLLEVQDASTGVSLLPTFNWGVAVDPDGDKVVYDLYLNKETDPEMLYAESLQNTTYTLSNALELFETYNWKVVARDGKGGEQSSAIFKFEVGPPLYLKEYDLGEGIKELTYTATNSLRRFSVPNMGDFSIVYGDRNEIMALIGGTIYNFFYDEAGRVIKVETDETTVVITYDHLDRMETFIKTYANSHSVNALQIHYSEQTQLMKGITSDFARDNRDGTFNIIRRSQMRFEWDENENLSYVIEEIDRQDGNGFVLRSDIEITYDTLRNPGYTVVNTSWDYDQAFLGILSTRLETFTLDNAMGVFWVSKNNVKTWKLRSYLEGIIYTYNSDYTYEYNEEGYPVTATRELTSSTGEPTTQTYYWKY